MKINKNNNQKNHRIILRFCGYTGSEQGKKRKRQDSTKESQNDDIKGAVPKQQKKARLGGQVPCDSENSDEPRTTAASAKKSAKNTPVARKNGKGNTTLESGKERYVLPRRCSFYFFLTNLWLFRPFKYCEFRGGRSYFRANRVGKLMRCIQF